MKLVDAVSTVFVICYHEDISPLEAALREEGFNSVRQVSREYTAEEQQYTRQFRCLLGHHDAWQLASAEAGLSIILEADFVPCKGFGKMEVPFPKDLTGHAWGWLYSCGQRVYETSKGYIRGHTATAVAYVLDAQAAMKMDGFVEHEKKTNPPTEYSPWDTYMRIYAREQGVATFLPFRSYGEHGGIANREHRQNNINPNHQADILRAPLHFLPMYAANSKIQYRIVRFKAYIRAWARLIALRYVEFGTLKNNNLSVHERLNLTGIGFRRLLPFLRNPTATSSTWK